MEGTTLDGATINAWVAHFSLENRRVAGEMIATKIATLTSQTVFTLAIGSAENDTYNKCMAIISDKVSGVQKATVYIEDYVGSSRTVTLVKAPGFTIAADDNITINALTAHIPDLVWDEPLTGANHNVATSAGRRLRNIQDFGIYDMASVWVDEINGNSTGIIDGEDATVTNRANDFDNAQIVAASIGLDNIHVQSGNTITLSSTLNGYRVWGKLYNIILGGQDIGNTLFEGGSSLSGTGTGTNPEIEHFKIGVATLPPCRIINCQLTSTLTLGSTGAYRILDSESGVAGAAAPTIIGPGAGGTTLEVRDWDGGLTLNGLASGNVITIDGTLGTITLNGADASVEIRGTYKSLVNNLTGSPTVNTDGALKGKDLSDIVVKLPSKDYLAGTNNPDGDIEADEMTGELEVIISSAAITEIAEQVSTDAFDALIRKNLLVFQE
jgi:hypothetical protein